MTIGHTFAGHRPVSWSCVDSCLTLGHSGCLLHALVFLTSKMEVGNFCFPDGRFSWLTAVAYSELWRWKDVPKLGVIAASTVRSPAGFKWDFCSLQKLFIWLFWTHPAL